jgi:branched-chain amino acid transport system permease protein
VSERTAATTAPAQGAPVEPVDPPKATGSAGRKAARLLPLAVLAVVLLVLPLYVDEFWLRTGFAISGAIVGALGLNLLVGTTGQLSLAHAFFLAVGAITYTYVSGSAGGGATKVDGLGLPPVVGLVLGVLLAGVAGLVFSPIAARLRGIYLGVASLGLVFIGQHVLNQWTSVTGGFNGRTTPKFSILGFSFSNSSPSSLAVLGVPFGETERLWYLGLALAAAAAWFAYNLLRSRPGRALQTLRDSEIAAAVMGVDVQAYKARVFLVSSMFAGLSGVMYALAIGNISPESFALDLSIQYLAMIVLGGLGSVLGAVLGATFVSALPLVFQQYADSLPFVSQPGQGGIAGGQAARFLYGAAVILVVLFEPGGLVGLGRRLRRQPRPGRGSPPRPDTPDPSPSATPTPARGSTS